ncbi:V-type ATP synthase subunit F [Patescibacteria group bacterium]|nr:V-type ATP synthase subunit F [Patescibacteria group bacterium]
MKDAKQNYKIAIIGNKDQILGFKALGITACVANNGADARESLFQLYKEEITLPNGDMKKKYAIIFILEDLAMQLSTDDYKKLNKTAIPAIIPIPGIQGTQGYGSHRIKKMVEQAVGSDIFG